MHSRFDFHYDGLIGEGWSGTDPDGAHVNVVLAERGTATAAALLTTFTSPSPGHAPILVVVGEDKDHYEPVWPPTIMINKATAVEERHQSIKETPKFRAIESQILEQLRSQPGHLRVTHG